MGEVFESCVVGPSEETPRHALWVSNLDLVAARGFTPTVYFYRSGPAGPAGEAVAALKAALGRALVRFYPLAGRLGTDRSGRVRIECTGEGAAFSAARSDSTADEFARDFAPSPDLRRRFVPPADSADPPCPLLMLQVTFLKCGGMALGFAIHHLAFDGRGASLFIQTFSRIARGTDLASLPPPFFDRTLLRARSPPSVLFDHSDSTAFSDSNANNDNTAAAAIVSPVVTAHLALSKSQLQSLKSRCGSATGPATPRVSTFRAVVAHVWRCACIARGLAGDVQTQLYLPVDVRARLVPPLPAGYIGNAGIRTKAVLTVDELISSSFADIAETIQNAVDRVNDDYVRSFIDHLDTADANTLSRRGALPRTSLCAISWLGMPMHDADFGWGEPEFMSRAQMYGSGYVYLMSTPGNEGGVSVILGLENESMRLFKKIFYEEPACIEG
ncbi:Shikimate O-hydroxycinnamoyltransferase [Ananas comosus]|uniref:Shikimate O-hydroxycinnamoyltransferase n=1 Tax=Ananas comosus TaxID=4615 RepID=A0A199V885_ANACO|nr:Shikimate O-hydroxycinnamoyltransferase [Ananas comosus]